MSPPTPPPLEPLVERLRALLAAATPGPWAYEYVSQDDNSWCIGRTDPEHAGEIEEEYDEETDTYGEMPEVVDFVCESGGSENREDAALIAEMRNALPVLLAHVDALTAQHARDVTNLHRTELLLGEARAALAAAEAQRKADIVETAKLVSQGNGLTREYIERRNAERLLLARALLSSVALDPITTDDAIAANKLARRIIAEAAGRSGAEGGGDG